MQHCSWRGLLLTEKELHKFHTFNFGVVAFLNTYSCGGPKFRISHHENQPLLNHLMYVHSINIVVVVITTLIIISAKTCESIGNQPAFADPAPCPQAFLSTFRIFTSQPKSLISRKISHMSNIFYIRRSLRCCGKVSAMHCNAQCVLCKVQCHCILSGPGIRYSDIFCVPGIR